MENSVINLDLYPLILELCDLNTLISFKEVNSFCYYLYKRELEKRLKSPYPFGEKNAKIRIVMNDIHVDKIFCLLDNKNIEISKDNMFGGYNIGNYRVKIPYVSEVLQNWFLYNFSSEKWIHTHKLFKAIIRLVRKSDNEDVGDRLTFQFKDDKSFLIDIV